MDTDFQLTAEDWTQFCAFTNKRMVAAAFPGQQLLTLQILVYIPFGMGLAAVFHFLQGYHGSTERHLEWALLLFAVWGFALFFRARYVNARYIKHSIAADGSFSQKQRVRIDESGISVTKATSVQHYQWGAIRDLVLAGSAAYFYLDTNSALVVPNHAFRDEADAKAFGERAKELMSANAEFKERAL